MILKTVVIIMDIKYMWIVNMELIHWSVLSSSKKGGDWIKGVDMGIAF